MKYFLNYKFFLFVFIILTALYLEYIVNFIEFLLENIFTFIHYLIETQPLLIMLIMVFMVLTVQ